MSMPPILRWIVLPAVVLAGCSVPPKPDAPTLRESAPLAGVPARAGQAWPASDWWRQYRDEQLDALESKALEGSPSLDEARTRFGTAEKSIDIARAEAGISIDGNAQFQRQRLSETGLIPPAFLGFTWYNQADLGVQFQYDFDFWGKHRAAIEAAIDEARAAEAESAAAVLMLTTAVADTYFGWQADQARLALASALIENLERNRKLAQLRVDRGIDSPETMHAADSQLANAREQQAAIAGSAQMRRAALAALLGESPADLPELAAKPLPAVAGGLPENASLDLIARRPDIAASRWRIEAALRRVDQARAEFYPDVSLSALIGLSSIDMDQFLTSGSRVMNVSPALHLPIFAGGRLQARFGASKAQLDAAVAQYDSAVVSAARDTATQALNLQQIDARRDERAAQVTATQALQDAAAARARRGLTDDRSVLAAQAQLLQQRDAATTLDAQAISADIALTKALGGGYRFEPPAQADATHSVSQAGSR
jgi:multidrug efflux system outer membrane protein